MIEEDTHQVSSRTFYESYDLDFVMDVFTYDHLCNTYDYEAPCDQHEVAVDCGRTVTECQT